MDMRKQMNVSSLDPITLLEVLHILREIACGESLELAVENNSDTEDLYRILSPEKYRIVTKKSDIKTEHVQVVIHKRTHPHLREPSVPPYGGSCCS